MFCTTIKGVFKIYKKVTLKDIANETGISFSLVSKVLNNSMNGSQISKEKARMVRSTASRMGYVTNKQARQLRTGKSRVITVIIPTNGDFSTTVYPQLIQGILQSSENSRYDFIFCHTAQCSSEDDYLREVDALNPDGIIYCVTNKPFTRDSEDKINNRFSTIERMVRSGKKILFCMEKYDVGDTAAYMFDDVKGGYVGTKHLIDKGYKKIFICVSEFVDRFNGYKTAMDEAGLPTEGLSASTGFLYSDGYEFVKEHILNSEERPEAIFASCDMSAWGILQAFKDFSIENIEVMGYDGLPILKYSGFDFATVVQPIQQIGKDSATDIVKWVEKGEIIPNKRYQPIVKRIQDM